MLQKITDRLEGDKEPSLVSQTALRETENRPLSPRHT